MTTTESTTIYMLVNRLEGDLRDMVIRAERLVTPGRAPASLRPHDTPDRIAPLDWPGARTYDLHVRHDPALKGAHQWTEH